MSDSDRGKRDKALEALFCILAVLGTVLAVYALGDVSGNQEGRAIEAAAQHQQYGKQQAVEACQSLAGVSMAECMYDAVTASQDAERGEQDLQAQQGMHWWAIAMVCVGALQTLVAGGALWFLKADLRQNRKSVEAQLRAYVRIDPSDSGYIIAGKPITIPMDVINYGTTPALNVAVRSSIVVRSPNWEWDSEDAGDSLGEKPSAVLHKGAKLFVPMAMDEALPQRIFDGIIEGHAVVYANIDVLYTDVFDADHETTLRLEFHGKDIEAGDGKALLRISSSGGAST